MQGSRNVGFVGAGKLGMPVCVGLGKKGHKVLAYDVNPRVRPGAKVVDLMTTLEAGVDGQTFEELATAHNPEFASSIDDVVAFADFIFVAVQTPHAPQFEGTMRLPAARADFNYSFIQSAVADLNASIAKLKRHTVVVVISTVLPGTVKRELYPIFRDNPHFHFAYNPYFIAMGTVLKDFFYPEFVLLGVHPDDHFAADEAENLYRTISDRRVYRTTVENAELIKVSYNTMISTKITFVNLLMEMCDKLPNTNVDAVTDALKLATDRLISPAYLTGGMGDGGGCHPRDNIALSWFSSELHLSTNFFDHIMTAREKQTEYLATVIKQYAARHPVLPVVVLGTAFKADTNIVVGSPAVLLCNILKEQDEFKFEAVDPHVDGEEKTQQLVTGAPKLFFVATKHKVFQSFIFPAGSIVIDPFRYLAEQPAVTIVQIGTGQHAVHVGTR